MWSICGLPLSLVIHRVERHRRALLGTATPLTPDPTPQTPHPQFIPTPLTPDQLPPFEKQTHLLFESNVTFLNQIGRYFARAPLLSLDEIGAHGDLKEKSLPHLGMVCGMLVWFKSGNEYGVWGMGMLIFRLHKHTIRFYWRRQSDMAPWFVGTRAECLNIEWIQNK
jgi:hypothetical protein